MIKILSKLQLSYWAILFSYISCFNLWFLSMFFINNELFIKLPLIISILITFALSSAWFLLFTLSMIRLNLLIIEDEIKNIDFMNSSIFHYILFTENIVVLGGFIYLSLIFNWLFFSLITISFSLIVAFYFFIDFCLKRKILDNR